MSQYNPPYTIGINEELINEFYGKFEDEMNEMMFVFMTEAVGAKQRTLIEACEQVVLAVNGETWDDWVNEEFKHPQSDYDSINEQSKDFCMEIIKLLARRFADEY